MDFKNHERRKWMPAYAITIEIVTTLLLAIRLLSRVNRTGGKLGLDDVFITIAWAIATVNIGLIVKFSYSYGLDRHIWDVAPATWPKGTEYSFVIAILFLFSTGFTKVSVLLFYRRLVAGTYSKRFKWALWTGIGFIVVYSFILFILLCVTCNPLEAQWLRLDSTYRGKYKCASPEQSQHISQFGGALSVITDFYSVVLPAMLLFKIRISKRQKIGLMFIFGLGFLVVTAGIVRTVYLSKVQGSNLDKTWLAFDVFAAGTAEGNLGIICACAPSLKSCFRVYFKDHFTALGSTIKSKSPWSSENFSGTMRSTGSKESKESKVSGDASVGLLVPRREETVYGGSIKSVDEHVSSTVPKVPEEIHRTSMVRSQPSFYITDTEEEGLPLSELPRVPGA